jgi:hypothetical protein
MMLTAALGVSTTQTRKESNLNLGNAACFLPSATDFSVVKAFAGFLILLLENVLFARKLSVLTVRILLKLWRKFVIK